MINRRQALLGAATAGIATIIPTFSGSAEAMVRLRKNYEREWSYHDPRAFDDVNFPHEQRIEVAWKIVERLNDMNTFHDNKVVAYPSTGITFPAPMRPLHYIKPGIDRYWLNENCVCVSGRTFNLRYEIADIMFEKFEDVADDAAIALKKEIDDWLIMMQDQIPHLPIEYYHYLPVQIVRAVNPDTYMPMIGFKIRHALAVQGGELDEG